MIFLHGWPQIGLVWRAQVEAFASEGWHCIAPDMRGYGGSSAPSAPEAYALRCASERGLRTVLGAADFFMEHF
jgi:pimeloyl-ACP methyl ester carboxylesterase